MQSVSLFGIAGQKSILLPFKQPELFLRHARHTSISALLRAVGESIAANVNNVYEKLILTLGNVSVHPMYMGGIFFH